MAQQDVVAPEPDVSEVGSPLTGAISKFRGSAPVEPEVDSEEEPSPAPDGPAVPETPVEAPAGTAEGATPEVAPVTDAAKTFEVELPKQLPGGGEDKLVIEGLPQEYADTIKFHVKRSAELPTVQAERDALRSEAQVAKFYRTNTLEAMHVAAHERPEVAKQFVESYMRQNWREVGPLVEKLGFGALDERHLDVEAKLAARDADDAVRASVANLHTSSETDTYVADLGAKVQDLARLAGLSGSAAQRFQVLAAEDVKALVAQRGGGLPPIADALAAIQAGALTVFARPAPVPTPASPAPAAVPAQTMKQKVQVREKFAKLQPGSPGRTKPTGFDKIRQASTLKERLALLRKG